MQGKEHPDTLLSAGNLAGILQSQGKNDEALQLYERANTGFEKTLGSHHPTTKACLEHYDELQRSLRASPLELKSLSIHR